jgi:hypothetical protein
MRFYPRLKVIHSHGGVHVSNLCTHWLLLVRDLDSMGMMAPLLVPLLVVFLVLDPLLAVFLVLAIHWEEPAVVYLVLAIHWNDPAVVAASDSSYSQRKVASYLNRFMELDKIPLNNPPQESRCNVIVHFTSTHDRDTLKVLRIADGVDTAFLRKSTTTHDGT